MIQLIIYDLDGTLIDSRRDIANAVNGTLHELGFRELPLERVSSFVGSGVKNLMSHSLKEVSPSPFPLPLEGERGGVRGLERAIKLFRRRYGEHLLDHTVLYPAVKKVLEHFKARKQAVVTNKPEDFSVKILRELGAAPYFFRILGGDAGFPKKPAPEPVHEILRLASVLPEEALFVGDSALDIETGRNAGVKTAAVTYGFGSREEVEAARPDFIFNDLEELIRCPMLK